jgi:hypothetical protein
VLELSGGGFQLLKDTLVSYKSLANKPSNDADKINTWVLQQSKVAGTNFGAYYKSWNWPVSDATLATLAGLNLTAFPLPNNFNLGSPPPSPMPPSAPLPPKPPLVAPSRCEDYATLTSGGEASGGSSWSLLQALMLHMSSCSSGLDRGAPPQPAAAVCWCWCCRYHRH